MKYFIHLKKSPLVWSLRTFQGQGLALANFKRRKYFGTNEKELLLSHLNMVMGVARFLVELMSPVSFFAYL